MAEMSGLAVVTCGCGCVVARDRRGFYVLDPENLPTAAEVLDTAGVPRPMTGSIQCVCGRWYTAVDGEPWIVERTDN